MRIIAFILSISLILNSSFVFAGPFSRIKTHLTTNLALKSTVNSCMEVLDPNATGNSSRDGYSQLSLKKHADLGNPSKYLLEMALKRLEQRKDKHWERYNLEIPSKVLHIPGYGFEVVKSGFYNLLNLSNKIRLSIFNRFADSDHQMAATEWVTDTGLLLKDLEYRDEVRDDISDVKASVIEWAKLLDADDKLSLNRPRTNFLDGHKNSQQISLEWLAKIETKYNELKIKLEAVELNPEQIVKFNELGERILAFKQKASDYPKGFLEAEKKVQNLYHNVKNFSEATRQKIAEFVNVELSIYALQYAKGHVKTYPVRMLIPQIDPVTNTWKTTPQDITRGKRKNIGKAIRSMEKRRNQLLQQFKRLQIDYAKNVFFLNEVDDQFVRTINIKIVASAEKVFSQISELADNPGFKIRSMAAFALTKFKLKAFSKEKLQDLRAVKADWHKTMREVFDKPFTDAFFDTLGINSAFGATQSALDSFKKTILRLVGTAAVMALASGGIAVKDQFSGWIDSYSDMINAKVERILPNGKVFEIASITNNDKKLGKEIKAFYRKHTPHVMQRKADPKYIIPDKHLDEVRFYLKTYDLLVTTHMEAYKQARLEKKIKADNAKVDKAFFAEFLKMRSELIEDEIDLIDVAVSTNLEKFSEGFYKYVKKYSNIVLDKVKIAPFLEAAFYLNSIDFENPELLEALPGKSMDIFTALLDLKSLIEMKRALDKGEFDVMSFRADLYELQTAEFEKTPEQQKFMRSLQKILNDYDKR